MSEPQLGKLPTKFQCPNCHSEIGRAMSMIGHSQPVVAKNMIMVCSVCAKILILDDDGMRLAVPFDINRLHDRDRSTIRITQEKILKAINQEGGWAPPPSK